MNITPHLLLSNGFKQYSSNLKRNTEGYISSYELRVTDEKGTKYFIHVQQWNHEHLVPQLKGDRYTSFVQFNTHSGKNTFEVKFFIDHNTTLDDIKDFYEKAFVRMEADYED